MTPIQHFHCLYVDHNAVPATNLGKIATHFEGADIQINLDEAYISTCQRLEYYIFADDFKLPSRPFSSVLEHARITSGTFNVMSRIARIAAGTESLLLGERFIEKQVSRGFSHLPLESPLFKLATDGIAIANACRKELNFYARSDYADLTFQLMEAERFGDRADALVVVGSGLLGLTVAEHPNGARYDTVLAVSRWPKKMRKHLGPTRVKCVHPEQLSVNLTGKRYAVVLAVKNITDEYLEFLNHLTTSKQCHCVIDLSSKPVIIDNRPQNYIHEYDDEFTQMLFELSEPLRSVVDKVVAAIDSDVLDLILHKGIGETRYASR